MDFETVKVQQIIERDIFEDDKNSNNDLLELVHFIKNNGVPLTDHQTQAIFLLNEYGIADIGEFVVGVRPLLTPQRSYFELINKITLADRIKGNAKLSNLMKANVANPNQSMPSANDLQAKSMKEKELGR